MKVDCAQKGIANPRFKASGLQIRWNGTYVSITDAEGQVEQELSYDAWGNLRSPNTWCVNKTIRPMFDRGYTGQEHLNAFGLVNMNGRMYDPVMSSFLSVDRYVQQPDNSQGFNRYAYCMYNPLKYVDPSGWLMSRPYGSGTIPPNGAPNKQPVAIDGGYRLAVIDGILYGGCYGDVIVTATGIQSSGSIFEDYPLFSSDRGFGSYDIGGENMQTISEASNYGGGGLGAFWLSGNNTQSKNVSVIASSINYSMSAVSTLLGATSYSYKQPQNRAALTELGKSLSKAQKAKLATKYPEISPKGASALKYGKAATKGMHNMGNAIGIAGTVVEAIDIVLSGEIRASKAFDIVIGIACVISGPYGWIIGGVALVGDIGFYAYTGRTIGGNIDRLLDDKSFRFWKGVY